MSFTLYFIEIVTSDSGKYDIVRLTKNSIVTLNANSNLTRIRSSRITDDVVETSALSSGIWSKTNGR